jgi:hypothetical protein
MITVGCPTVISRSMPRLDHAMCRDSDRNWVVDPNVDRHTPRRSTGDEDPRIEMAEMEDLLAEWGTSL